MKKITFILIALISGTAFAQNATGTATVEAEIVSPILIASSGSLNFGKIASAATTGDVTVTPGSTSATYTNTEMEVTGGTISYPTFTVTAESAYQITLPSEATLEAGEEGSKTTMKLKDFTTNLASNSGVTAEGFWLGATLEVGGGQTAGVYTGEVEVTVSYE